MFEAPNHDLLVPYDSSFRIAAAATAPTEAVPAAAAKKSLRKRVRQLGQLQSRLYAHDKFAVLLVFQALDAAGKDSTIRAVMSGINPAGCQVFSFKKPSTNELDHDFLWRTAWRAPQRGRIGIFNRSYYEEVLVVKVLPELLKYQKLPYKFGHEEFWAGRYESIRDHEKHLARSGTLVLKFFLNVSRQEQKRRFLARIDEPNKNWKFEPADLKMRQRWDDFMAAYERALNETSRPWAPWYSIPADDKPTMRLRVAEIVAKNLVKLEPRYPQADPETVARLQEFRNVLKNE